MELPLGKKLVCLVYNMYTGELLLRYLIINLDGSLLSDDRYFGLIGKLLYPVTDLDIHPNFTHISLCPFIKIPQKAVQDLSTLRL